MANATAWICALGPQAVDDYQPVVALAERALAQAGTDGKQRHDILNTLGAVLCRAGRHKEALARLDEGIKADNGESVVGDWLFLALVHEGLGEPAMARKWLAKVAPPAPSAREWSWGDLETEVLRREVATLLKR